MEEPTASLSGLSSQRSSQRLEEIANLRSRGIAEHINLPQLVVCGDQSAGKSSVLEGITGLPFPRQDGICTRFATEIMLMHTEGPTNIQAEIIPAQFKTEPVKVELASYKRTVADFRELPAVITEAGTLMGVRGFGESDSGTTFAHDVLRIKVMGPIGLHLTVVDLPGLIAVVNEQQTEDDVQAVHSLVDSYVENSRSIILAVVQANNDIANQAIIQKSKRHDRRGERTIGIITKPDLLNTGTEGRIAALARNRETTRLKLGFFLLKNPSPSELAAGYSYRDREKFEKDYFAASPWREQGLDLDRTGVTALRGFLQQLLDQHIERELPKVRDEISLLISKTGEDLTTLGEARPTPGHMRIFLSRIAMQFHRLVTAALHGDYHGVDAAFFETTDETTDHIRLRALVHNLNTQFADEMRERGQTMIVVSDADSESDGHESASEDSLGNPQRVSRAAMNAFVMKLYRKTRGRELPGNYNHVLLAELFHHQSKGWKVIAKEHIADVLEKVKLFISDAVQYTSVDDQVTSEMRDIVSDGLNESKEQASEELDKLCNDKAQQPITYNHYYTDNIANARRDTARNWVRKAMQDAAVGVYNGKLHISNTAADADKLLNALQREVSVDMDEQACSEVLAAFSAYYKVARKTFVDNVCIQAIERHVLRGLPDLFSPETVAGYADHDLRRIAGEDSARIAKRRQLLDLHENLNAALRDLRK